MTRYNDEYVAILDSTLEKLTEAELDNLQMSLDSYASVGFDKGYQEGFAEGETFGYDNGYESAAQMMKDYNE